MSANDPKRTLDKRLNSAFKIHASYLLPAVAALLDTGVVGFRAGRGVDPAMTPVRKRDSLPNAIRARETPINVRESRHVICRNSSGQLSVVSVKVEIILAAGPQSGRGTRHRGEKIPSQIIRGVGVRVSSGHVRGAQWLL
jgi:hypothetical protein